MIVVVTRTDGKALSAADSSKVGDLAKGIEARKIPNVERVVPGQPSPNKLVQTVALQMPDQTQSNQDALLDSVETLRADIKPLVQGSELQAQTAGQVSQSYDQREASGNADAIVAFGTILLIILLLAIIFRSPIIAFLPILVIGIVSGVANGLIADLNKGFGMQADSSISSLLIVVLFGVGTDYILFLLFRYRERLRAGDDKRVGMVNAVSRVGEAIASAAGVVMIAFLAMTLSSLSFFRSMGPSLAVAVGVTLVAGLTLVPAIVSLLGPRAFWPSKSWKREPQAARFGAIGDAMAPPPRGVRRDLRRRHGPARRGGTRLQPDLRSQLGLDPGHGGVPGRADAAQARPAAGRDRADRRLPAQRLRRPTRPRPTSMPFASQAEGVDGVGSVGEPQLNKAGDTRRLQRRAGLRARVRPRAEGRRRAVARHRTRRRPARAPPRSWVASPSVFVDIRAAMNRDYKVVFPVAALLIMLILGLMLRSIIAPIYLMLSVGLGFVATLGATTLIFQDARGEPGLIFLLPLIMYMFVVALGTDYNILMMSRLREEAKEGLAPRPALAQAIRQTGPTIAAAGVILAGSFAVLLLAGNSLLSQMGFAIAFGILVAAFAMATFFTPAVTALIGHAAWWPGHADAPAAHDEVEAPRTRVAR